MSTNLLLVELFTEELPPKSLKKLSEAFAKGIADGLVKRGLVDANSATRVYATPRRMAVQVEGVRAVAADQPFTEKLMPAAIGLTADGQATPALQKKMAAKNLAHVDVATLKREGDQLVYQGVAKGQSLQVALQSALEETIAGLPVAKVMSYQLADGQTTVQFVRPAHSLVALHDSEVVDVGVLGLASGRNTSGHRFQGKPVSVDSASTYSDQLQRTGGVIAGFDTRRDDIHAQLKGAAAKAGASLGEESQYAALLDEVTALVEMPTVYQGEFESEFLAVPAECLILTMKLNQKYFPLFGQDGKLSNRFLIVSNMRLADAHNVIEGNQRVVRPRLSDARFFFETDKKTRLADRIPRLSTVVYHNKLGSQGQRVERVKALAGAIAKLIGADVNQAERAALLAKADLVTDMVGEFPELQGTMGRYYALHDGEPAIVADAIAQHYQPRFAGDALPETPVALAVAMADKLETLAGLFGIGQLPTGDKDPFGLRRHALGVLRMLIEKRLAVPLGSLVDSAFNAFPGGMLADSRGELAAFFADRLRGLLRETGYSANEVEAVIEHLAEGVHTAPVLLAAVRDFSTLPEAASLAAANKRIGNILKKSTEQFSHADAALLAEPAERALFDAMQAARPGFERHVGARDFTSALKSLAPLKTPVDAFFDGVMVNAEDPKLRANRLALLADLHGLMNKVADLSKLAA